MGRKPDVFIANPFTHLIFTIYVVLPGTMAWYTEVATSCGVFYI